MSDIGSAPSGRAPSEEEFGSEAGPSGRSAAAQSRRGTRACDRCRKIKSRCESAEGSRCRNCVAAGTACTFQGLSTTSANTVAHDGLMHYTGPSFKRGPPKGYIHAIEQRWHQVECILATIMASPRSRDIVADLRQDRLARAILDRVEAGPYGSVGRGGAQQGGEGLYSTIMTQSGMGEDSRSKRQSRLSREIVSSQGTFVRSPYLALISLLRGGDFPDTEMSAPPTVEWQEQLYRRLSGTPVYSSPVTPYSNVSSEHTRFTDWSSSQPSPAHTSRSIPATDGEPSRRRRRIDGPTLNPAHNRQSQQRHDPEGRSIAMSYNLSN
ncbi:uncharacterized protein PHACADRAFT_24546 [Phanerochaete carnosa HHB-10118-sp]|uniref:Zn(2)-C6 fungal-type domain-containing protein n=1 Tax=Phanerochaete carnosa (strain HHB-10118-sp) TaxID=650164 RepID=K5VED4_PHACS|nr:uncharacterized protein PHACADRAFT_24546 [Phanerochaete carnosa HHB-10118-sp]EKM61336.1 hypothetical protein PHACADRAFT_24546 [Phanerochaete carnosa HHB-10118-sp]